MTLSSCPPIAADLPLEPPTDSDLQAALIAPALDWSEEEEPPEVVASPSRYNTDLVRIYLHEIGRVPLLDRDEEVAEAQAVQRYMALVLQRDAMAQQEGSLLKQYVDLQAACDRLTAQLTHHPSLERWAQAMGMHGTELRQLLQVGKQHWAEAVGLSVEALNHTCKEGQRAKEHMIKANLRLVVSVAKKYQNRGLELLDLVQEGTLGLERAVEKFDPTKGYRFSTYAYWWIRQGVTRAIATQSRTIRLPIHITEKLNKIKKAQRKIAQEKGHTASLEEVAREMELTPEQVRDVLMQVPRSISLETRVGREKDTELADLLEASESTPEERLTREAMQRDIWKLLSELTSRERAVLHLRFGLKDGQMHSLSEIAQTLELSRERVRQIETKALQKLRHPKRRTLVQDYFEELF